MDGGGGEGIGMKRRKKAGAGVLAVMLALMPVRVLGGGADTTAGEIEVTARAAVAMEAETGRVLHDDGQDGAGGAGNRSA